MGVEVVRSGTWTAGGPRSFDAEGAEHGAGVTLILTDMAEGRGPRLHKHPYGEIWVVASGRARFTGGGEEVEASTGDIVYVSAETPHKFVSIGEEQLRMVCIHEAPKFTTVWLEPKNEQPET
jgi:mannose-6-phosphate isomerase-like protein (cupin superfamily)